MPQLKYKRILLKLSGEALAGPRGEGVDIALAERVKKGGPEARAAYLGMLQGGSSKPPLELL